MRKTAIIALVCGGAALAALVPAVAGSMYLTVDPSEKVARLDGNWRTDMENCSLKRVWKQDYSGKPYLSKVRVCA